MKYLFNNKISCKFHVLDFFNYFILSFHLYTIDREISYFYHNLKERERIWFGIPYNSHKLQHKKTKDEI